MARGRVRSAGLLAASLGAALVSILLLSRTALPGALLGGGPGVLLGGGADAQTSECAGDPKCASSITGLVGKAARLCASDPDCICDWTHHAQACFFKVRCVVVQGYLAHKKHPPPSDQRRSLGIGLL